MKLTKFPTEEECDSFNFSKVKLQQVRAIRLKCLDCCGFSPKEVALCVSNNCSLYPFRMGRVSRVPTITLREMREKTQQQLKKRGG